MHGRITISGIRFHAFHGLTKLERKTGVRYCVDVAVIRDISLAARSDEIADTVDYRELHDLVVEIGRKNTFHLIETLVTRIATEILKTTDCESVEVDARKETPVVEGIVDSVGVAIAMRREDLSR